MSRPTARKWVRRFEAEGEAGLEDRPATPRRRPHRLSPARERVILDRRDATLAGPHPIGWTLGENPATVHRVLARHARPRLWELDVAAPQVVRYERDRPGELVHVDVTKQGRIPHGGGWRAHGRGQAARLEGQHQRRQPAWGRDGVSLEALVKLGFDFIDKIQSRRP